MSVESEYFPPDHPAIEHHRDQIQAQAIDIVRKASGVFLVAVIGEGEEAASETIAYGSPVVMPIVVQDAANTYLIEAVKLAAREGLVE